jgi:hypothetical protein
MKSYHLGQQSLKIDGGPATKPPSPSCPLGCSDPVRFVGKLNRGATLWYCDGCQASFEVPGAPKGAEQ